MQPQQAVITAKKPGKREMPERKREMSAEEDAHARAFIELTPRHGREGGL
jgi:hypothetical protein